MLNHPSSPILIVVSPLPVRVPLSRAGVVGMVQRPGARGCCTATSTSRCVSSVDTPTLACHVVIVMHSPSPSLTHLLVSLVGWCVSWPLSPASSSPLAPFVPSLMSLYIEALQGWEVRPHTHDTLAPVRPPDTHGCVSNIHSLHASSGCVVSSSSDASCLVLSLVVSIVFRSLHPCSHLRLRVQPCY
jgi:hypothetical protein